MKFKDVHEFLTAIQQQIDPSAIIAGGYLRDAILGAEPKDVDIWLYNKIPHNVAITMAGHEQPVVMRSIYVKKSLAMNRIVSFQWKGITFDVLELKDRNIHPTDRFDFGINQVWYDGQHLHKSDAFKHDEQFNTLSYINTAENYLRLDRIVKDRIPRMLAKYPTRTLRGLLVEGDRATPDRLDMLVKQLAGKRPEDRTEIERQCWAKLHEDLEVNERPIGRWASEPVQIRGKTIVGSVYDEVRPLDCKAWAKVAEVVLPNQEGVNRLRRQLIKDALAKRHGGPPHPVAPKPPEINHNPSEF